MCIKLSTGDAMSGDVNTKIPSRDREKKRAMDTAKPECRRGWMGESNFCACFALIKNKFLCIWQCPMCMLAGYGNQYGVFSSFSNIYSTFIIATGTYNIVRRIYMCLWCDAKPHKSLCADVVNRVRLCAIANAIHEWNYNFSFLAFDLIKNIYIRRRVNIYIEN